MTYRSNPAWLAARADYIAEIPGENPAAALVRRNAAAHRMFAIETTAGKAHR